MTHEQIITWLNRICITLFIGIILGALYIMSNDIGLIEGLDFGPGSYYYSDIPGWEKIFYTDQFITPHTDYPILFMVLFVVWGIVAWKTWVFLDRKFK